MMEWDWYQATAHAADDELVGLLLAEYDISDVQPCTPVRPFDWGRAIVRGGRELARVFGGGVNPHPHVLATGGEAPALAGILRRYYPDTHYVSRADSCVDFAEDAFDKLSALALEVADLAKLKTLHVGDFHRCEDGRSIYIGAPSSVARVRVYEKHKELGEVQPRIRVELQARPKKRGRLALAHASADEAWGITSWARNLAVQLGGLEVPRFAAGTVWAAPDVERARDACVTQYGPTLRAWVEEAGGLEAWWSEFQARSLRRST